MSFSSRTTLSTRLTRSPLLTILLTGVLAVGLALTSAGCGGAGSNGGGNGNGGDTTPPSAPSGLSAEADNQAVSLSWNAVDGAASYRLYRATSPTDSASGSPLNTDLTEAGYTDESAENGTTYYYRVTAVDTAGNESDGSGEAAATPFGSPSEVTSDAGDQQVSLTWAAAGGAETYNVYRSTSSTDEASGDPLESGVSETSFVDESAENGTTYYYRITSVNPNGIESAGSGEVLSTPFSNPTDLQGTSGDSQVELEWSAATGADSYSVYRSTESTDEATGDPLTTGVSQAAFTDTTAENGTQYYYRITSVNPEDEESTASNEVTRTPFSDPSRP